ncbi:hypothetical protein J0664_08630 [Rhizobium leguminosarum]|uniref:hypothetical protein n=1 Tax=Rhizobium leguminosarum TaxID=384 RepID=UPI001A9387CD|nr:hypothetical protein [Rhizobium leguminosarum]MBY5553230.1 hypothetical protein [Rhizobium leguminosarum]QSW26145.1 hypothetical protein J0664_08630 [Rhizobium leguminosarum]
MFMKLNVLVGDVSFLFGQGRSHVSLPRLIEPPVLPTSAADSMPGGMRLAAVVVEQQVLEPTKHA